MKGKANGDPAVYGARWMRARAHWLREHPLCKMHNDLGQVAAASVVDHIVPHRLGQALASGDEVAIAKAQKLFWDTSNWQSLCDPCHNSHKQRLEKSGKVVGCNADGIPIDPHHPWHNEPGR